MHSAQEKTDLLCLLVCQSNPFKSCQKQFLPIPTHRKFSLLLLMVLVGYSFNWYKPKPLVHSLNKYDKIRYMYGNWKIVVISLNAISLLSLLFIQLYFVICIFYWGKEFSHGKELMQITEFLRLIGGLYYCSYSCIKRNGLLEIMQKNCISKHSFLKMNPYYFIPSSTKHSMENQGYRLS